MAAKELQHYWMKILLHLSIFPSRREESVTPHSLSTDSRTAHPKSTAANPTPQCQLEVNNKPHSVNILGFFVSESCQTREQKGSKIIHWCCMFSETLIILFMLALALGSSFKICNCVHGEFHTVSTPETTFSINY